MGVGANSFSENFNSLTLGDINGQGSYTHASTWSTTGTGATCWCRNHDSLGSYHLALSDGSSTEKAVCSLSLDSGYQSETGYIQFKYYHPTSGKTSYVGLQSSASESDWICGVGLNYTNYIRGNVGGSWFDIQAYSAATWYTIKIVFDTVANTAAFWVDGSLKTTKTLIGSTDAVTHIYFRTTTSGSVGAHFEDLVFAGDATATVYSDSGSETLLLGDVSSGASSVPAETDFRYYLGSYDGKVYLEHPDYFHDDNATIPVHLITKVTDFSEENPSAHDAYKTVYSVRLWYVDKTTSTSVILSVSNDEGTNWTTNTKTIGTGSGLIKSADFFYPINGHTFQFKVENNSADKDFQWMGLEISYNICGDYFEIN